jgi:hypothetical protein
MVGIVLSYYATCYAMSRSEVHWLNTIKVPLSTIEAAIGATKMDHRARHFFILGTSLSPLFDISGALEYLRAILKLLDEWEGIGDGGANKVVSTSTRSRDVQLKQISEKLVQGSKVKEVSYRPNPNETLLHPARTLAERPFYQSQPFPPDFYTIHATTCSILRDIYKKCLSQILPPPPGSQTHQTPIPRPPPPVFTSNDPADPNRLFHPSTFIGSAVSHDVHEGGSLDYGTGNGRVGPGVQMDAFQAFLIGELGEGKTLVGDGQNLTPQVVETFLKVDLKLRVRVFHLVSHCISRNTDGVL